MKLRVPLFLLIASVVSISAIAAPIYSKSRSIVAMDMEGSSINGKSTLNLFSLPLSKGGFQSADCYGMEGNTLSINPMHGGGVDLENLSSYYVQLIDGTDAGAWAMIESFDMKIGEITLSKPLSPTIEEGMKVRIGRCHTLFSVFGEFNTFGLKPGATLEEADEVIVFEPDTQTLRRFYVSTEAFGWVEYGNEEVLVNDIPLLPSQALICRRKEEEIIRILLAGVVDTEPLGVPLYGGVNLLPNNWLDEGFEDRISDRAIENYPVPEFGDEVEVYRSISTPNGKLRLRPAASKAWLRRIGLSVTDTMNVVDNSAIVVLESNGAARRLKVDRN